MKTHFPLLTAAILFACFLFVQNANAQISVTATAGTAGPTSYTTLKASFDAINAGTHKGVITIAVTANTTETSSASLNASGSGSASYTGITISPSGGAARTISGTINGALIALNGSDNVTINGLNTGGNSLIIENTYAGTSASTVTFSNGATGNMITNCSIKGSNTYTSAGSPTGGVIYFSTGANTSNSVTYCNVGPSGSNKPTHCIVSVGSSYSNSSNTVDHCNIFDYSGGAGTSIVQRDAGIYLFFQSATAWTISNNSFYQTATRNYSSEANVTAIHIRSGHGYTITGNYIGGSSANFTGTMTYTGTINQFLPIDLVDVQVTTMTTISGNYIQGISYTSSSATSQSSTADSRFAAISIQGGGIYADIYNNTIGKTTETGNISISLTSNPSGNVHQLYGIHGGYYSNQNTYKRVSSNTVSGITVTATNGAFYDFTGIYLAGAVALEGLDNNLIGSTTTANSINLSATGQGTNSRSFMGIYFYSSSISPTLSNNTVQNITRTGSYFYVTGININLANSTISGSTVKNLTSNAAEVLKGINLGAASQTVSGCTIDNLSGAGIVYGIYNYSATPVYKNNFIKALKTTSASSDLCGIFTYYGTIYNNIIVLGYDNAGSSLTNLRFYGIYMYYGASVYFNTVYIGGTGTSGTNSSYALKQSSTGTTDIRNNIFVNARTNSGGTGSHYAISLPGTSGLTINYNDYYAPGSGGVLGYLSVDKTTLALWQTATAQDLNSLNTTPSFASAGGSTALSYLPSAALAGVSGTGITTDYAGSTRAATPTMGAYEGSFAVTWDGSTDSDWNTGANWSTDAVPNASANVTIPDVPNDPIVNQAPGTPATCNNITINSGAVLTIAAGKALTIYGTLTNNAGNTGLVVNTGGSLIENTAGIAGTVKSAMPATEWHLISSPISDATSAVFTGEYLQSHSESTNAYTDITLTTDALTPVKGYAVYGDADITASYAGTLNTGNQTYSTAYSGAANGWNLVGNPYPCSIDWSAVLGWTKTNLYDAIYVHRNSSTWATYIGGAGVNSGTKYIAPGQGFFVQSTAAGTLAMTNAVKVHNATTFFKNSDEVVPNLLRIEVSGNSYKDEAVVRFAPEATAEFDGNYDAHKLYGDVAEAAQVYTLGSIPLAINSLPATSTVPLGIYTGAAGTYTLAATEINDLTGVTLEDTHTGIFTDLTKSPCSVELTAGESGQRFVLHFGPLSIEDKESTPASIYSYRHTAYISMNGNTTGDIFIYTISGQLVATLTSASGMNEVQLPVSGTYIVKVVGDKTMGVKKVFIN